MSKAKLIFFIVWDAISSFLVVYFYFKGINGQLSKGCQSVIGVINTDRDQWGEVKFTDLPVFSQSLHLKQNKTKQGLLLKTKNLLSPFQKKILISRKNQVSHRSLDFKL